jgi:hypothetical protein
MSPNYSVRRGKRYRYYVSRGLVRGARKEDAGPPCRIGAEDVERLVVEVLAQQLSRPELVSEAASGTWSAATRTIVRDSIDRVVVGHGEVQIIRKVGTTRPSSSEVDEDCDTPKIYTAPLPGTRPRARKEIIVPGGRMPRRINHALMLAIARAKKWMHGLREGKYEDTAEIARRFKLNDAHVRRVLRLGYLAPDIIEAIVEGRQPRSLTVKRLLRGIPCSWADQRTVLGLTPGHGLVGWGARDREVV